MTATVLFVSGGAPHGNEEAFAQAEVTELLRAGHGVLIVPYRRRSRQPNRDALDSGLAARTIAEPLLGPRVVAGALAELATHPRSLARQLWRVVTGSRGRRNLAVNVLALPKAAWIARLVRRHEVTHLHAYWLSHTATAAMVASALTGVPYSASGYRWDIDVDNLLDLKFASSSFLRCADEVGQAGLLAHPAAVPSKVELVRTGVTLAPWDVEGRPCDVRTWCCPGAFVEKKAQHLIVDALAALRPAVPGLSLELFGDGPLGPALREQVDALGLGDVVTFHGHVPLTELQRFLVERRPVCILPSIRTASGEMEGIPVSLVEAMAAGAPVVSTPTGSIEHLVRPGTGVLVEPGSADALARALRSLADDPAGTEAMAARARARVAEEFDLAVTSARLWTLMTGAASGSVAR